MASRRLGHEVGAGIDVAERGGLEQAAGVDVVLAEQVGHGAGDLDQPVDAAGGDGAAALDQLGEGAFAEAVELAGGGWRSRPGLLPRRLGDLVDREGL